MLYADDEPQTDNDIGAEGANSLAEGLKTNHSITDLDLASEIKHKGNNRICMLFICGKL